MIALFAIAAMPAAALAQDTTSQGGQPRTAPRSAADTNRAMKGQTPGATSEAKPDRMGTSRATGMGGNQARTTQGRRSSGSLGMTLSRENVMQLQTALSGVGCDAGTADGIVGPRTRRAITCARQKNNVSTNDELYRSLNLDFGTGGTTSPSGAMSSDSSRMQPPPTTGDSAQPRDSTPAAPTDSTSPRDSTQRQ